MVNFHIFESFFAVNLCDEFSGIKIKWVITCISKQLKQYNKFKKTHSKTKLLVGGAIIYPFNIAFS